MSPRDETLVRVWVPLAGPGGRREWLWAEPVARGRVILRNVPYLASGLANLDEVEVSEDGQILRVARASGRLTVQLRLADGRDVAVGAALRSELPTLVIEGGAPTMPGLLAIDLDMSDLATLERRLWALRLAGDVLEVSRTAGSV